MPKSIIPPRKERNLNPRSPHKYVKRKSKVVNPSEIKTISTQERTFSTKKKKKNQERNNKEDNKSININQIHISKRLSKIQT